MNYNFRKIDFFVSIPLVVLFIFFLWQPFSSSQFGIKYYGHYFVEDPGKNQAYVNEVKDFTNIINMRYDNGPNNSWDPNAASRVKNSGVKVMLQVPFGSDSDQTLFVNGAARDAYLAKIKQDMISTDFMSSLAYIAIYEEWYVLISQGFFDKWPIFQGKTKEEKFAIAKYYLEQIINDVHNVFPGIPTVIVENILPYPVPPSNVDVLGIDAYYIPSHSLCSSDQKTKFDQEVLPYFDAAAPYNKPIMMVAPSFIGGPWKMLSECQMQWYSNLAISGKYKIESFLWFFYADVGGFVGVRNYPDLVTKQKSIGCQMLGGPYCVVPPPEPSGPVGYRVNLKAYNGQYVVAEGDGGGVINANRNNAYAWETFTMIDLNGGKLVNGDTVAFNTELGYYFTAKNGGGSTLDATSKSPGNWETLTIQNIGGWPTVIDGDRISIKTSNSVNYVVAEGGGGGIVNANRTAAYAWETFTLKVLGLAPVPSLTPTPTPTPTSTTGPANYTINLRANNGQYVVAEGDGGGVINANRDWAQGWETFKMIDLNGGQLVSGDKVSFGTSSGYYFRAGGGGGSTLDATARGVSPWETFTIQDVNGGSIVSGDKISIRTWNGTYYVVAEGGGGGEVAANRTAVGAWETFTLTIK